MRTLGQDAELVVNRKERSAELPCRPSARLCVVANRSVTAPVSNRCQNPSSMLRIKCNYQSLRDKQRRTMKSVTCVQGSSLIVLLLLVAVPGCLPRQPTPQLGCTMDKDAMRTSPRFGSKAGGIRGVSVSPSEVGGGREHGRQTEEHAQRNLVTGGTPVRRGEYPFLAVVNYNSEWNKTTNSTIMVHASI
jgi:hypothetical protein